MAKWFKFYGQDWLTDIKIIQLKPEDRLCYLTLLCLASVSTIPGRIKDYNEDIVIQLTQLYNDPYNDDNEFTRAKGFTKRFIDKDMVFMEGNDLIVKNFVLRQETNLTNYEMVNRSRIKKRIKNELLTKDKDKNLINDKLNKNRIEETRIDKNNIYILVFNFWNDQKIIIHKKITDKIKRSISGRLTDGYSLKEIKIAIKNYADILKDDSYYFKYKWTLQDFLQRGFEKFKDKEIAEQNYKKEMSEDDLFEKEQAKK